MIATIRLLSIIQEENNGYYRTHQRVVCNIRRTSLKVIPRRSDRKEPTHGSLFRIAEFEVQSFVPLTSSSTISSRWYFRASRSGLSTLSKMSKTMLERPSLSRKTSWLSGTCLIWLSMSLVDALVVLGYLNTFLNWRLRNWREVRRSWHRRRAQSCWMTWRRFWSGVFLAGIGFGDIVVFLERRLAQDL